MATAKIAPIMDKQYILQEVKRAIELNNGVAPGWRRFKSETGIRYHDWFGVHWARWSDALREAGATPNQLQGACNDNELLERYAELAHELCRLPTKGDMRLKRRTDPGFPSGKTFDRLGTKLELTAKLAQYCKATGHYEDVTASAKYIRA